jgi:hypothetical protein
VTSAAFQGYASGDFATVEIELGTHPDWAAAGDAYRGARIEVIADAPSLTLVPGTYAIPHREEHGPIWSAMIVIAGGKSTGNNARGELVIDEITASKTGKTPATVRGHLWVCVDPIPDFPGPQWIGGTFTATVKLLDQLYKVPAAIKVETGRIVATRRKPKR